MTAMSSSNPRLPEQEKLRIELGQLVDQVWEEAAGRGSPEEHVRMRGAAYGFAVGLFIAGKLAARPPTEALERVIAAARERAPDSASENRSIAEAVIRMMESR
jgi:hypothetical protein